MFIFNTERLACYFVALVLFSVRIFRNSVGEQECTFKCWAIELVSERCIASLLDRVVDVKPTYILMFSEIQSPRDIKSLLSNFRRYHKIDTAT